MDKSRDLWINLEIYGFLWTRDLWIFLEICGFMERRSRDLWILLVLRIHNGLVQTISLRYVQILFWY